MTNKLEQYADLIIQTLLSQGEFVKIYIIPIMVFLLDFLLRLFIGVDISDVGADMALLATAAFLSMIADEHSKTNNRPFIVVVFQIMFMLPWIFCLWSVSRTNPLYIVTIGSQVIDIHIIFNVISWFVGLTSLILSGIFINRITADVQPSM